MKNKLFLLLAAIIVAGSWQLSNVFAEKQEEAWFDFFQKDGEEKEKEEFRHGIQQEAWIKYKAKELGIETEGKDLHALAKEVKEAKLLKKLRN